MPQQLQLFFDEVHCKKQEAKELRNMFRDALENDPEYQKLRNDIKRITNARSAVIDRVLASLGTNAYRMEEIKQDIRVEKVAMTDAALAALLKGENVLVQDSMGEDCMPVWSVKFVKVK